MISIIRKWLSPDHKRLRECELALIAMCESHKQGYYTRAAGYFYKYRPKMEQPGEEAT